MAIGGRYELLGSLGQGGMARVVRARDLVLGRDVALKLMDGNAGRSMVARFAREARAIARLDHPGCVRILDSGPTYLVMELIAGQTLADRLEESDGQLGETSAVRITRAVLAALAHAHARGVLHRDIKPGNVMLANGRVVVVDFGLAWMDGAAGITGVGACAGSPSYLAPERLLGKRYDARADVYAVGVMLYEMLAGVRPFVGRTPEETMKLALTTAARPLRAAGAKVSAQVEAVVARALAKDPNRRFADAEDMRSALEPDLDYQLELDLGLEPALELSPDPEPSLELDLDPESEPSMEPVPVPRRARRDDSSSAASTVMLLIARSWWSRAWARLRWVRWRRDGT